MLVPKPDRTYQYGVVTGGYEYHPGNELPHWRRVDWKGAFSRDDMSPALASSAGVPMTVFQLAAHPPNGQSGPNSATREAHR